MFNIPACGHIRCYTEALACALENLRDSDTKLGAEQADPMRTADEWARYYLTEGMSSCQTPN